MVQASFFRRARVAAFSGLLLAVPMLAPAQVNPQVMPAKGPLSKQTMTRVLLTDVARSGNRTVAIGDRGYIVVSDNNGQSWERAESPPNLPLLTAVTFADAKTVWAVGHDSVILKSSDEGKTWKQAYSAAKEQKPLLDVLFLDANHGFAIGAYGTALETTDGGATWNARKLFEAPKLPPKPVTKGKAVEPVDEGKGNDDDKHLNSIVKLKDGRLLVVGESGTLLTSADAGKSWSAIPSPYKGSFFGAVEAEDGSVVIYGLRGKIFRADATLANLQLIENKSVASIMGATRLADGRLVLAGLAGTVLMSNDHGKSFTKADTGSTKAYAAVVTGAPSAVLLVGEAGARDLAVAASPASGATREPAKN